MNTYLHKSLKPLLCASLVAASFSSFAADPLPSWNDGAAKTSIIEFVEKTTDKDSSDFIPVSSRIATFDNDGTLWSEKPAYFQLLFAIDQIKKTADQHPEWKTTEPFASILKDDLKGALAGGEEALFKIVYATHSNISQEDFQQNVKDWIKTAKHPTTGRLYSQMIFQPMLELLDYLRDNDYKTFIVSGGEIDFMRAFTEEVYGIPPEQVVGSRMQTSIIEKDGKLVVNRDPKVGFVDDKIEKVSGIYQHIGRRPVAAFGNSDGDLQMLQYTTQGDGARFGLYVHHTDAEREWAYDKDSDVGALEEGLVEAKKNGWTVVDMKQDWKVIYPQLNK